MLEEVVLYSFGTAFITFQAVNATNFCIYKKSLIDSTTFDWFFAGLSDSQERKEMTVNQAKYYLATTYGLTEEETNQATSGNGWYIKWINEGNLHTKYKNGVLKVLDYTN